MIFETHAHYDDEAFDEDRDTLLQSLPQNNIKYVVNIGASLHSTKTSIELAHRYPFIYAAAGVHPSETGDLNEDSFAWLKTQCSDEKVLAVGEIGLDYYWLPESEQEAAEAKKTQQKWFRRQLQLAGEVQLPVVIHSRDAARDTLDILREEAPVEKGGIIHCYSYTKELARDYLDMGYYFGIGGVITFKNGKKLREAVEYIPLERIVLETDSPYLAPEPFRGKRNSSLHIPYVVEQIAQMKGITPEEVEQVTYQNACKLYQLK